MQVGDLETDRWGQEWVVVEDVTFEDSTTPMSFEENRVALLKIATELADAEFQAKLFLGETRGRFSDPDYMLKVLYDIGIEEFFEEHSNRLPAEQQTATDRLIELTINYESPLGSSPGAWKEAALLTLADPSWQAIQNAAKDFVAAMS